MYTLITIAVLLVLLSLTYIKIRITFHRIYEDDILQIKLLFLFGLIKFNIRIPYMDLIINRKMKIGIKARGKLKTRGETLAKKKEVLNFDKLKLMYERFRDLLKIYRGVIDYMVHKIHLDNLKWHTEIGLEDAAATAISTGALWSIKGSIAAMLSNAVNTGNIQLNVKPCYNKLIFEMDLDCIIRVKIANIIIAGIKAVYILVKNTILKKGGEINEPASYRRANENHNG